jgi:hypothetical protein
MDQTVIDGEWHSAESPADIREYITDEKLLENERAGYGSGPEAWGPVQWDGWDRSAGGRSDIRIIQEEVTQAEDIGEISEQLGI